MEIFKTVKSRKKREEEALLLYVHVKFSLALPGGDTTIAGAHYLYLGFETLFKMVG